MSRIISFATLKAGDRLTIKTAIDTDVRLRIEEVIFGNPHLIVTILEISVRKGHNLTVGAKATLHVYHSAKKIPPGKVADLKNKPLNDLRRNYYGLLTQDGGKKFADFQIASLSKR